MQVDKSERSHNQLNDLDIACQIASFILLNLNFSIGVIQNVDDAKSC